MSPPGGYPPTRDEVRAKKKRCVVESSDEEDGAEAALSAKDDANDAQNQGGIVSESPHRKRSKRDGGCDTLVGLAPTAPAPNDSGARASTCLHTAASVTSTRLSLPSSSSAEIELEVVPEAGRAPDAEPEPLWWECSTCTFNNPTTADQCDMCGTLNPCPPPKTRSGRSKSKKVKKKASDRT